MWRGFLTQFALAFDISLKEKNAVLRRSANILPTSLPSIGGRFATAGVGWIEIVNNHLAASVLPFVGNPSCMMIVVLVAAAATTKWSLQI
jgi:hypothetical protein